MGRIALLATLTFALFGCDVISSSEEVNDQIDVQIAEALATTSTIDPDDDLPEFPGSMDSLALGNSAWALILGASEGQLDPILETAKLAARSAGYDPRLTDCDNGELATLGLPENRRFHIVAIYFSTETAARTAEEAFTARGIGSTVARVQITCLD